MPRISPRQWAFAVILLVATAVAVFVALDAIPAAQRPTLEPSGAPSSSSAPPHPGTTGAPTTGQR